MDPPFAVKAGKDKRGWHRFFCQSYGRYFAPTKERPFFHLHKPGKDFPAIPVSLVEPNSLAVVARVKEEIMTHWLEKAWRHAQGDRMVQLN